ncbi:MAG: hypothetical protein MR387_07720 [Phocaeicola plebeius]|nr:hypothetical protein [Phocaeicola plebeius]
MKTATCTCLLVLLGCLSALAQNKRLSREEFRERQRTFFTQQADLTSQEADRFFPLYFELQDKKGRLNHEAMEQMRKGKEVNLTEAEYDRIVESILKSRITSDELELEYLKRYKEFLSSQKIYRLQKAEMHFHRELLKDANGKRKK